MLSSNLSSSVIFLFEFICRICFQCLAYCVVGISVIIHVRLISCSLSIYRHSSLEEDIFAVGLPNRVGTSRQTVSMDFCNERVVPQVQRCVLYSLLCTLTSVFAYIVAVQNKLKEKSN